MFDRLTEDLLELSCSERGSGGVGNALPAIPLCCSLVLCVTLCSSSSKPEPE